MWWDGLELGGVLCRGRYSKRKACSYSADALHYSRREITETRGKMRPTMPDCFSYIRFSTSEQHKGSSQKAQQQAIDKWLSQHPEYHLKDNLTDLGLSGYSGKHLIKGELKAFLDFVRAGRATSGSVLLVSRLDRLSRLPVRKTITMVNELLDAGIKIVLLDENITLDPEKDDALQVIIVAVKAEQSHDESKKKSQRVAKSYDLRHENLAHRKVTSLSPTWLIPQKKEDNSSKNEKTTITVGWKVDQKKADIVRDIYKMAADGKSVTAIIGKLAADGVKPFRSQHWNPSTIHYLIRSTTSLGSYQPTKNGRKYGRPHENYYPAIISQDLWDRANFQLSSKRSVRGNDTERQVFLLDGLLYSENDDCKMYHLNGRYYSKKRRLNEKGATSLSIEMAALESVCLLALEELRTIKRKRNKKVDADELIASQYQRIEVLEHELESSPPAVIPTILSEIAKSNQRIEEVKQQRAREKEPKQTLNRDYSDRVGLRAAIRTLVKKVTVFIVKERSRQNSAVIKLELFDETKRHCFIWVPKERPVNDFRFYLKDKKERIMLVGNRYGIAAYEECTEAAFGQSRQIRDSIDKRMSAEKAKKVESALANSRK